MDFQKYVAATVITTSTGKSTTPSTTWSRETYLDPSMYSGLSEEDALAVVERTTSDEVDTSYPISLDARLSILSSMASIRWKELQNVADYQEHLRKKVAAAEMEVKDFFPPTLCLLLALNLILLSI